MDKKLKQYNIHFAIFCSPHNPAGRVWEREEIEKAMEVYRNLSKYFMCTYDEAGNIGKRYRRQDVIGTPFAITIDDNTINNNTVTIRDRDTMEQITISLDEVVKYIEDKVRF